jgi:hypothetical protein
VPDETLSGADGAYVIEAGPAGNKVMVIAKLPGWTPAEIADSVLAPVPRVGPMSVLPPFMLEELNAGQTARRDLAMVAGGSLNGRVVDDATGEGIAGADVAIRIFYCDPVLVRSSSDGTFWASSIGAGRARVSADAEGYLDAKPAGSCDPKAPTTEDGEVVDIPAGATVNGVTVRLRRGLDLLVLVTDPDGSPMPGASVSWHMVDEDFRPNMRPRATTTDRSGMAKLKGLGSRAGTIIAARHPRFPAGGNVTVDTTSPPPMVTIVLDLGASIVGVALDADGRPAADRKVTFWPEKPDTARAFDESMARMVVADASGKFVLENLPSGPGSVGIAPTSLDEDADRDDCLERGRIVVALSAGKREEVRLQLVRSLAISGVVVDAAGKPLAKVGVEVLSQGHDGAFWDFTETADDGTYRFAGLCPGNYRVTVHETQSRDVAAGSTRVDFRLTE